MVPSPLFNGVFRVLVQDQERAYFDSADWVLGKVSHPFSLCLCKARTVENCSLN
jgi:hypothetical protein